jgi:hypothetical protein
VPKILRHLLCVLALMWTGLVNGQPFFFATDSTNYIRAADVAVYVASHHRFSTVWTSRYKDQLDVKPDAATVQSNGAAPDQISRYSSNDLRQGVIMGGRSPYIGALMYLGYVAGDFWPFVLFQAVIAYLLILLVLRRFGITGPRTGTAITLALAATTSLPTYVSFLLADAFASFGILAFLLLATRGKLSHKELAFLGAVLAISVSAHMTHTMMLIGMVGALALLARLRWVPRPPRRAWVAGFGGIVAGLLSVQLTAEATKLALGHQPQLMPLLTARFIADGPGKRFIDSGCAGGRFEICHIPIGRPDSNVLILFGSTPETGAYMLGNAEQRRRMGQQDTAFAVAVLRYDPPGVLWTMARNTVRQFLWIDYDGLNQDCFDRPDCWNSLPDSIRAKLKATPSGRGLWPQASMNALLYVTVGVSLLLYVIALPVIARRRPRQWILLREWLLLGLAAMLVSSFFGGAVADPQYRYQGRLIWLVPFFAAIALCLWRQALASSSTETGAEPNRAARSRAAVTSVAS